MHFHLPAGILFFRSDQENGQAAWRRQVEVLADEPLIVGFDVSGGWAAWNVIRFRRGPDARSYPPIRISGEARRDRSVLIANAAEILGAGVKGARRGEASPDDGDALALAFARPVEPLQETLRRDSAAPGPLQHGLFGARDDLVLQS